MNRDNNRLLMHDKAVVKDGWVFFSRIAVTGKTNLTENRTVYLTFLGFNNRFPFPIVRVDLV
jgi:hypothetical protein